MLFYFVFLVNLGSRVPPEHCKGNPASFAFLEPKIEPRRYCFVKQGLLLVKVAPAIWEGTKLSKLWKESQDSALSMPLQG